ncbi:MAG: hypothetical protein LWX56_03280 [Ignavibacteria bacterium]|nr:hypothetical protein [Ignavibacteria bacterium]
MKCKYVIFCALMCMWLSRVTLAGTASVFSDSIVTDWDGNHYHTVAIGGQVWLQENLASSHYWNGQAISGAVNYQNSDSLGAIYGKLYSWDAAMNGAIVEGSQGACPSGWHVPSDKEWSKLESFLGGVSEAGMKLKESGTVHWKAPNTYSTNSSGFSLLPAGEFDAHYTPNVFQLMGQYAVLWTSTQTSSTIAKERYFGWDTAASMQYNWYKTMKYSVRCLKDTGNSSVQQPEIKKPVGLTIITNFPNPFNPSTTISIFVEKQGVIQLHFYNSVGLEVDSFSYIAGIAGVHAIQWKVSGLPSGVYICSAQCGSEYQVRKMILLK